MCDLKHVFNMCGHFPVHDVSVCKVSSFLTTSQGYREPFTDPHGIWYSLILSMHYVQFNYSSVDGGFIKHVNIYGNQNQTNTCTTCNCIVIIWFDLQCCITLFAGEYSKKYLGSGHDIPNSASNIPGKIQTSEFYLPDMTMEMVITMRLTDKVCLYPSIYSGGSQW